MSATDAAITNADAPPGEPEGARYGTLIVVGGGCYGSYYVRQLGRARVAGALAWERLLVVDRNSECRVATERSAGSLTAVDLEVVTEDWRCFFARYLGEATSRAIAVHGDAIVPSPLMPHLLFEWLVERARTRWPGRRVETASLDRPPHMPWQRAAPDRAHYVSFAEWICPINCIEPPLCPHIRGPRTWSMPPALRAFVAAERARGAPLEGPLLFHCTHRAYGVGMIDTRDVVDADAVVARVGTAEYVSVLVGTVSHCHGALGVLEIGSKPTRPASGSEGEPDARS